MSSGLYLKMSLMTVLLLLGTLLAVNGGKSQFPDVKCELRVKVKVKKAV